MKSVQCFRKHNSKRVLQKNLFTSMWTKAAKSRRTVAQRLVWMAYSARRSQEGNLAQCESSYERDLYVITHCNTRGSSLRKCANHKQLNALLLFIPIHSLHKHTAQWSLLTINVKATEIPLWHLSVTNHLSKG